MKTNRDFIVSSLPRVPNAAYSYILHVQIETIRIEMMLSQSTSTSAQKNRTNVCNVCTTFFSGEIVSGIGRDLFEGFEKVYILRRDDFEKAFSFMSCSY